MLKPNIIPKEEPEINVGIILPQDNQTLLNLKLPVEMNYTLGSADKNEEIPASTLINITLENGKMVVKYKKTILNISGSFKLTPQEKYIQLEEKSGLKVYPVISGRGFHWQKEITVYLPDTLIIKVVDNALIVINQLPLEHYLACVATSEMSAKCPGALIQSQTITARSWLLANVERKHEALEMDVCNDDCCQRYQGTSFLSKRSFEGAISTAGKVLIYDDKICDARYSKSCGGIMEEFQTVWPGKSHPYLQVKPDSVKVHGMHLNNEEEFAKWVNEIPETFCSPHFVKEDQLIEYLGDVDEQGSYFRWELKLSQEKLIKNLNEYAHITASQILGIAVLNRGGSGRVNFLKINYLDSSQTKQSLIIDSEYKIRRYLSDKFLYSSAIAIITGVNKDTGKPFFNIKGAGWGHGVGLCQIGALGMALAGYASMEILKHYYPDSKLTQIY